MANYEPYVSPVSELYHFGIFGMKWGYRRFQNPDGTWTEEGLRRRRAMEETYKHVSAARKEANARTSHLKDITDSGKTVFKQLTGIITDRDSAREKYIRSVQEERMSEIISQMDSKDIQAAISRLKLERDYKDLLQKDIKVGRSETANLLNDVGTVLALGGSVAGLGIQLMTLINSGKGMGGTAASAASKIIK